MVCRIRGTYRFIIVVFSEMDENLTNDKVSQTGKGKVMMDKRHSHFRISATKDEAGDLKNIDMLCSLNADKGSMCGDFVCDTNKEQHEDGTKVLKDNSRSRFSISAKKDALGDISSVELDCCIDTDDNIANKCTATSKESSVKRPCCFVVLKHIFALAWKQLGDQLWNLFFTMLIIGSIGILQYTNVVSIAFCGLEDFVKSVCPSIAGLTFAALTLILPLAKFLQVENVDYHKELAGTFSYTILINLLTLLCALVISLLFSGCCYMWINYLLAFMLVYSIILACSATMHCFCIHTFMNQNK